MRHRLLVILLTASVCAFSQSAEEWYNSFKEQALKDYDDFRDKANADYAGFLRAAWEFYSADPAIENPKEEPVPPVIFDDKEQKEQKEQEIKADVVPQPKPQPQPQPIAPVIENEQQSRTIKITFYGLELSFRAPKTNAFTLPNVQGAQLAKAWESMATDAYTNLLYDCLAARNEYKLCDWSYLTMLQQVAQAIHRNANEATLLQAFLYANSGYKMRLAVSDGRNLHLLIGSDYVFYDVSYYTIEGGKFFPLDDLNGRISICDGAFQNEKSFSLLITEEQRFPSAPVPMRTREAKCGLSASCSINKNLIDFYNTYPTGQYGDDFGTRWAAYANAPLDEAIRKELYPQLQTAVRGVPESKGVGQLLNWVQTAFEYEYDDKVWGQDRAFFPAESLHYPYCDCEDRSILFSRIVRDLTGLDVVLLYYPGHLATAVAFNEDVKGDYLTYKGRKYTICDPTYIGAGIGRTMPGMNNQEAKIIPLR